MWRFVTLGKGLRFALTTKYSFATVNEVMNELRRVTPTTNLTPFLQDISTYTLQEKLVCLRLVLDGIISGRVFPEVVVLPYFKEACNEHPETYIACLMLYVKKKNEEALHKLEKKKIKMDAKDSKEKDEEEVEEIIKKELTQIRDAFEVCFALLKKMPSEKLGQSEMVVLKRYSNFLYYTLYPYLGEYSLLIKAKQYLVASLSRHEPLIEKEKELLNKLPTMSEVKNCTPEQIQAIKHKMNVNICGLTESLGECAYQHTMLGYDLDDNGATLAESVNILQKAIDFYTHDHKITSQIYFTLKKLYIEAKFAKDIQHSSPSFYSSQLHEEQTEPATENEPNNSSEKIAAYQIIKNRKIALEKLMSECKVEIKNMIEAKNDNFIQVSHLVIEVKGLLLEYDRDIIEGKKDSKKAMMVEVKELVEMLNEGNTKLEEYMRELARKIESVLKTLDEKKRTLNIKNESK